MTRRPPSARRRRPATSALDALRGLVVEVPPGDFRAAVDAVRTHPLVAAAREECSSPSERTALSSTVGGIVSRSLARASVPF